MYEEYLGAANTRECATYPTFYITQELLYPLSQSDLEQAILKLADSANLIYVDFSQINPNQQKDEILGAITFLYHFGKKHSVTIHLQNLPKKITDSMNTMGFDKLQ